MTELEDLEFDLSIAKHNVWVAETEVTARKEELRLIEKKIEMLRK